MRPTRRSTSASRTARSRSHRRLAPARSVRSISSEASSQTPIEAAPSSESPSIEARQADAVAEANLLDDQILQTEQQITRLRIERDARVAEIRQQRFNVTEDRDVTAWEMKMDQEIKSVHQDYSARIVSENAQLDSLGARRAVLIGDQAPPQ